jgi:hypothetical protein
MPFPQIDQFLIQVPSYTLSTPLALVIQGGVQGEVPYGRLIVVDHQNRPVGALGLGHLWDAPLDKTLGCLEPWLEPIVQVTRSFGLNDLWPLLGGTGVKPLVVVDSTMAYIGVINADALLGWLTRQVSLGPEGLALLTVPQSSVPPPTDGLGTPTLPWVVELSHAIKTPMTTLLGLSTLLLDSRLGSLSDRQFRYVALMRQAIRKIMALINQLLDWIRLESDQLPLQLEPLELERFLTDLLASFPESPSEGDTSHSPAWIKAFTLRPLADLGVVIADPLRLRQSLHYVMDSLLQQGEVPTHLDIDRWGPWLGLTVVTAPAESALTLSELTAKYSLSQDNSLEALNITLARRLLKLHGGDINGLMLSSGQRLTLLLPVGDVGSVGNTETKAPGGTTVLVGLLCPQGPVVTQVYTALQGSPYRLVWAATVPEWLDLQQRLKPLGAIVHTSALTQVTASLAPWHLGAPYKPQGLVGLGADLDLRWQGVPAVTLPEDTFALHLKATLDQLLTTTPLSSVALPPEGLTLILLGATPPQGGISTNLQAWLQHYHCRLLQVDDLPQAAVLSRVWQPHGVIVVEDDCLTLEALQALAQCPELAALPVVTLTEQLPEAIAIPPELQILPCGPLIRQAPHLASVALIRAIAAAQPNPNYR